MPHKLTLCLLAALYVSTASAADLVVQGKAYIRKGEGWTSVPSLAHAESGERLKVVEGCVSIVYDGGAVQKVCASHERTRQMTILAHAPETKKVVERHHHRDAARRKMARQARPPRHRPVRYAHVKGEQRGIFGCLFPSLKDSPRRLAD